MSKKELPTEKELIEMGLEYQEGKPYPTQAQEAEDQYIYETLMDIVECWRISKFGHASLERYIGIYRGMWQDKYGFYRPHQINYISGKKAAEFLEQCEKSETEDI